MSFPRIAYVVKDFAEKKINKKIVVTSRPPFFRSQKRFLSVRMDVTNRCNLKCMICPRSLEGASAPGDHYDIDQRLFRKIAGEIFPNASELFLSCGSEPLIAKHFCEMLDVVAAAEIPFVGFTTNGLLVTEDNARKIIQCGINEIEISFDGATGATFKKIRGGASMEKVIEKVRLLNSLKAGVAKALPVIAFHITLLRSNIDEIQGILEIARDLGVPHVRALHFYPHSSLNIDGESLYYHKDLYDSSITLARAKANELGIDFISPPLFRRGAGAPQTAVAVIFENNRCVFPWTMVRIAPNGEIFPCATWLDAEPFGNLVENSFSEIWYGPRYRQLRDDMRNNRMPKACRKCPTMTEFASFLK
jgi:pyrroloquinoline quinone biosynthesis protein E